MVPDGAAGAGSAGCLECAAATAGAGAAGRSGGGGDADGLAARLATAARPVFAAGHAGTGRGHGGAAVGTRLEPVGRAGTRSRRRSRLQPQHAGRDAQPARTRPRGLARSGGRRRATRRTSPGAGALRRQGETGLSADARLRPFPLEIGGTWKHWPRSAIWSRVPGEKSGTRLGQALSLAATCDDPRFTSTRDILLLSDGDDPGRDAEWRSGRERPPCWASASTPSASAIRTRPASFVSPSGPLMHEGQPVRTRLEEAPLRAIAETTGGIYTSARTRTLPLGFALPRYDRQSAPARGQRRCSAGLPAALCVVPRSRTRFSGAVHIPGRWLGEKAKVTQRCGKHARPKRRTDIGEVPCLLVSLSPCLLVSLLSCCWGRSWRRS